MDINYLRRQHKEVNEVLADLKNRLEPYDKIPEKCLCPDHAHSKYSW